VSRHRLPKAAGYSDSWGTPPDLIAKLDAEFGFTLDVCASRENAKADFFFAAEDDALSKDWIIANIGGGAIWMNPPFSQIDRWIKKAYEESRRGATVVCLVPCRTDSAWWHQYIIPCAEVRFLRGRIRFVGAKHNAPFPCAVVIFGPNKPPTMKAKP